MYENYYLPCPDVNAYLSRIGISKTNAPTPEFLTELVRAHQQHVPFETYDLCELNREISLEIPHLFEKIVVHRRGGYCFELNCMFYTLLRDLGFDAYPLLARIVREPGKINIPKHRATMIRIDGKKYYADVGMGGPMPNGALLFENNLHQNLSGTEFWFEHLGADEYILCLKDANGQEKQSLRFYDHIAEQVDFIPPNYLCSANPDSMFRKNRNAALLYPDGFANLHNMELRIRHGDREHREILPDAAAEAEALKNHFGIILT